MWEKVMNLCVGEYFWVRLNTSCVTVQGACRLGRTLTKVYVCDGVICIVILFDWQQRSNTCSAGFVYLSRFDIAGQAGSDHRDHQNDRSDQ
jgi:hypothetical protein